MKINGKIHWHRITQIRPNEGQTNGLCHCILDTMCFASFTLHFLIHTNKYLLDVGNLYGIGIESLQMYQKHFYVSKFCLPFALQCVTFICITCSNMNYMPLSIIYSSHIVRTHTHTHRHARIIPHVLTCRLYKCTK